MKIREITEAFNHPQKPKSDQIFGDLETEYNVQDLLDYATHNLPIRKIPLSLLIKNTPPFSLPGTSDEEDNSPEFRQRTAGLTLRDYLSSKYPPILVIKTTSGKYDVADGRHRVVNFVHLLTLAHKNPLKQTVSGFVMDQRILNNISTIAKKNE